MSRRSQVYASSCMVFVVVDKDDEQWEKLPTSLHTIASICRWDETVPLSHCVRFVAAMHLFEHLYEQAWLVVMRVVETEAHLRTDGSAGLERSCCVRSHGWSRPTRADSPFPTTHRMFMCVRAAADNLNPDRITGHAMSCHCCWVLLLALRLPMSQDLLYSGATGLISSFRMSLSDVTRLGTLFITARHSSSSSASSASHCRRSALRVAACVL
eukprot:CAMPEP_0198109212 /NCGR_PEP_ID=MMETSP1442-20131203/1224_1 /TAXON_ID= /ORGANISM="Craspedostauros australis, Strain CCMP3328" /LENGTH=212 /DNA_ID=CAMNT_0043764763 /DNA_START=140 /DNA_END=774 /DNA_ORIENTATION=-